MEPDDPGNFPDDPDILASSLSNGSLTVQPFEVNTFIRYVARSHLYRIIIS